MSLFLAFPLIFLASLVLFLPSLNYYFSQDDWFVLNWVQNNDFLSLVQFRTDIIYWRPISMPLFFKLNYLFFGLNPLGYHLTSFAVHLVNSFLVFLLFKTLNLDKKIALLIAFLYATAAFHFVPLSWLSTTSYIIGPTFILASLILLFRNKMVLAIIAFILALASSEFAIVTIPITLLFRNEFQLTFKKLLPFMAIAIFYLTIRFFIFPLPARGEYEITLAPKVATNAFWYLAWIFNVPEKISTIFFFTNIKGSITQVAPFLKELIFPALTVLSLILLTFKTKLEFTTIAKGLVWFAAGILPVIFLLVHTYSMYVVIAALGLFYLLAVAIGKLKTSLTQAIIALGIIWFISSFLTISFTRSNHWIPNQQAIARSYIAQIQEKVEKPETGTIFLIKPADVGFSKANNFTLVETEDNVKQSLNDQDAVQVIFKDRSLNSVYTTHQKPITFPSWINLIEISPTKK